MAQSILSFLLVSVLSCHLAMAQIPSTANKICPVMVGEKLPNVELMDSKGVSISSDALFLGQKVVLIVYRGGWCPYCNKHLSDLARIEDEVLKLGYKIIAVSPDSPKNLKETESKFKFKYQLLSDAKGKFSKALGVAYKVPNDFEKVVDAASEGENKEFLPVPSVFVLNTKGEIIFEYINPDFKKRISGGMLISVVSHL